MTDRDFRTRTEGEGETLDIPEGMGAFAQGQVLGERYQIIEMLGRGGMGEVWQAFDLKLRVEVALKALRPEFFKSERRLEMLRDEVRAAREVVSPNVCRIFDLIEIDGRELVSMEYVDGATLLVVLQERGPLDLKEAQDIASQFLAGLEAIHKVGLVHRDIKPENIMLTRAGRVVVMDFGLARQEAEGGGSVSGTPAYMAPEQAAGQQLDARADVYAAGVVLAEMVSPDGIKSYESRQSVWEGLRSEPAQIPETPWAAVITRAVARDRKRRQNSAHTLIRELEDVTLRVEGAEDLHPYPGLASFTAEDSDYFFGREAEVEQVWRRLRQSHLLAIVGASGAGKTSFIGAGLMPNSPPDWEIVRCTPGDAATSSLRRSLIHELAGNTEALEQLVDADSIDAVVSAACTWRGGVDEALLVVDQFEELFTQNTSEEQAKFAELLGRLVVDADIRVLVSMRDDFLIHCNRHEALRPLFSELTPLDPPAGAALRRAVTQPALKCGYRYEDDNLVEEIMAEVEGERGALPLLAFAASQLWERRDRETGLLTREAYREIGGVGGSLAQHAEATIDRIGGDRIGTVREVFRNLVTSEGTRAVREWNELLSVFETADVSRAGINPAPTKGTAAAEEVLRELIDSRLLTSYEIRGDEDDPARRVEIIHESLLANWPRLVRWQIQDQDGARLREELRTAARTWDDYGRPDDRLWTGTALREYQLWRERYPGGLTEIEESFAASMNSLATRRRRRRRIASVAGLAILIAVLAVVTSLWRQSVREANRAEASKLVTLGRIALEEDRTEGLAFAIAGLRRADTPQARRLALRALWAGPPATVLPEGEDTWGLDVSPDGRHIAVGFEDGTVMVFPRDGGAALTIESASQRPMFSLVFSPNGQLLVGGAFGSNEVRIWETAEWTLQRILQTPERLKEAPELPGFTVFYGLVEPDHSSILTVAAAEQRAGEPSRGGSFGRWILRRWPLFEGPSEIVGEATVDLYGLAAFVDPSHQRLVNGVREELHVHSLASIGREPPRIIGRHSAGFNWFGLAFDPTGQRVAVSDMAGTVRFWPLDGDGTRPEREIERPGEARFPTWASFNQDGTLFADATSAGARMWRMSGPTFAEPMMFSRRVRSIAKLGFTPDGQWLVTSGGAEGHGLTLWPLSDRYPRALVGATIDSNSIKITGDGSRMFASSTKDGAVHTFESWSLTDGAGLPSTVHFRGPDTWGFALDPLERFVLVGAEGLVHKIPLDGGAPTALEGVLRSGLYIGPKGRYLAVRMNENVHVHDLETGEIVELDVPGEGNVSTIPFDNAGRLVTTRGGVVSRWDPESRTTEILLREEGIWIAIPLCNENQLYINTRGSGDGVTRWIVDLDDGTRTPLPRSHQQAINLGWDEECSIVASAHGDGEIHVGRFFDEETHLLIGPDTGDTRAWVSADRKWVVERAKDGTVRLWPIPDLSKPPFHTLPYREFMAKLEALTNLRAVPDENSPTGYRVEHDFSAYRGWETVPTW